MVRRAGGWCAGWCGLLNLLLLLALGLLLGLFRRGRLLLGGLFLGGRFLGGLRLGGGGLLRLLLVGGGEDVQVFELVAGRDKGVRGLALSHANHRHAGLPQPGGQPGEVAVRGHQAEAVHLAGVENVLASMIMAESVEFFPVV